MTDLPALERRIASLESTNRLLLSGLIMATALGLAAMGAARPSEPEILDKVIAREITVVDANGRERVVIAAPLPEPRLAGALSKRGDPVSGLLLFDADGNERGGYVTGDGPSSQVALTLDEIGRMAVTLWAGDRGSSGMRFGNQDGDSADLLINTAGAFLTLRKDGRITAVLPASDTQALPAAPEAQ